MLPPTSYFVKGELSSPKFAQAFALGCKGLCTSDATLIPGSSAAFWTPPLWPMLNQIVEEKREYYYADHGFWQRGKYFRIARNAFQYRVTDEDFRRARPTRFGLLNVDIAPEWQKAGGSVVICPNSPHYMRRFGIDASQWVLDLVAKLNRLTDRPIVIRWKSSAQKRPLYHDLHAAWMVVTFSSNAAIEALAAGVPVCTLAPWATSAPMGISRIEDVEKPYYPDKRIPFLWALADRQWTLSEISLGLAWRQFHVDA